MTPTFTPSEPTSLLGFDAQRLDQIPRIFELEVAKGRLPGAVMRVARKGHLLLHAAVGQQDPASGRAMAQDAIFRINSMTKPIVSVAVMQLVERGCVLLDDPVARHLPEFANVQLAYWEGETMRTRPPHRPPTVQDLLRHTAGLTYEQANGDAVQALYAAADIGSRARNNAAFSKALADLPLMFEPGTVWEYSRATDLLGALVEAVTAQTLGAYLQAHILGPLGMVDTAFSVPADQLHRLAEPFAQDPDGAALAPLFDVRSPPALEAGGAGLVSTTQDYARFAQCLLDGGQGPEQRILSPHTVRWMRADHLGRIALQYSPRASYHLNPGVGFGLGFDVRMDPGMDTVAGSVGTYGWSGSAGTVFWIDPAQELQAILMTQAPNQRAHYLPLFRNLVYAALVD
jgi:CubicO group peptidase (beta-lactamase class C family)